MENNFDKEVKKMLENFEVKYTPMDWNLMEEKIEEHSDLHPELEDALIDGMAFDSLHNLEVDFNSEHWNLMREKLDAAYAFRRKLMKYKVAEVALVAFFIFTLVQFLPIKKLQTINIASTETLEVIQNNNSLNSSEHSQELSNQVTNNQIKKEETAKDANQVLENTSIANPVRKVLENQDVPFYNKPISNTSSLKTETANSLDRNSSEKTNTTSLNEGTVTDHTKNKNSNNQNPLSSDINIDASLLNPILLKDAEELELAGVEELNGSKVFSDLKKPIKVRIGMAVGVDANYVMTPFDKKNFLDAFNQFAPGYSGGFVLGFQYNKWEIETGALYSAVSYKSRNFFEIKGSFAEGGYVQQGLEGAQLDLIRIPLNLKYNFFTKKKWNMYAYSGTSVNMMVETFYNFTTTDVGNSLTVRDFAGGSRKTDSEEELKFESHDGIFEGGRLSKNTFMTANLGFGVERYFTPRMSMFLQPGYQHQFSKGLGPQSDLINSVTILTGAKVTLKKRKKSKK